MRSRPTPLRACARGRVPQPKWGCMGCRMPPHAAECRRMPPHAAAAAAAPSAHAGTPTCSSRTRAPAAYGSQSTDACTLCVAPQCVRSRSDIKLPHATQGLQTIPDSAEAVSKRIKELLAAEKDFYVIVQSACGVEMIMDTKVMTEGS